MTFGPLVLMAYFYLSHLVIWVNSKSRFVSGGYAWYGVVWRGMVRAFTECICCKMACLHDLGELVPVPIFFRQFFFSLSLNEALRTGDCAVLDERVWSFGFGSFFFNEHSARAWHARAGGKTDRYDTPSHPFPFPFPHSHFFFFISLFFSLFFLTSREREGSFINHSYPTFG